MDGFGEAEAVVDLSDEPVLGPEDRFRWASQALAAGLSYIGADFRFDPPVYADFELPSIAVIGAGKRVGKTALSAHLASLLARERDVVVVAMGRGGPAEPEVIERRPTVSDLVEFSRSGRHAASDYLEIAAICGVPDDRLPPRRRRARGAGFVSNVVEGARLAAEREPDVVVFDSSGASIPPIAVDRRVLLVGDWHDVDSHFNTYRRLVSDLVVAVNCELPGAVSATLRLRPLEPLEGRVAVFTAGPADVSHLDADVVHVSSRLADRDALRGELARLEADTYLVEIKAAAIDVVAEDALARGRRVVLAANDVVGDGLDEALLALLPAMERARVSGRRYGEPLPLGEPGGMPYSKGLMARALIAAGVSIERAYELATRIELDLAERDARSTDLDRRRGARVRGARLRGGLGRRAPAAALRRAARARPADPALRRRRDRHRQVDRRHRGGAPARDHARHLDRLHPPDDARVLLRGVHAVDPLLELRGRAVGGRRRDRRPDRARLPRADAQRARRRRRRDPARAHRGLVDGARGRAPRARAWCRGAIDGVLVVNAVLAIESEEVHRTHFHVRDIATGGVRAMDKYLEQLDDIRRIQTHIVRRAEKTGVPVIESSNPERAIAELMELVLRSAERLEVHA